MCSLRLGIDSGLCGLLVLCRPLCMPISSTIITRGTIHAPLVDSGVFCVPLGSLTCDWSSVFAFSNVIGSCCWQLGCWWPLQLALIKAAGLVAGRVWGLCEFHFSILGNTCSAL